MSEIKKFKNKEHALELLLEGMPISDLQKRSHMILAISHQGVWFAKQLSQVLQSPFTLFFTTPIPAPLNPDCNIAMVSETYELVIHDELTDSFDISHDYIYGEAKRRYEEHILSAIYSFRKGEMIQPLEGKHIIIVDDGVDTGMVMTLAVKSCVNAKARSISVVTPVIPYDVGRVLRDIVDEIYAVFRPHHFIEIESYYEQYTLLSAAEVEDLLKDIVIQSKK